MRVGGSRGRRPPAERMNSPQRPHEVRLRGLSAAGESHATGGIPCTSAPFSPLREERAGRGRGRGGLLPARTPLLIAILLLLALSLALPAAAQEPPMPSVPVQAGCMARHLREAAALNRARMPLYDSLTQGRSRGISRRLIWTEWLALPVGWWVDRRARRFQREGIPIVCDDFVPMAGTPAFRARIDHPPPLSSFVPADARRIRRTVERAEEQGGFSAASEAITAEIERLEAAPAYHCMLRHLLESALRISNQAPRHAAEARARGLADSPADLSRTMLDLHLGMLGEAARLDRRAAPLQAEGIPLLCQDVPPIPPAAD